MNWDRASIEKLLRENDRAVERAMVVLYQRQTADEQAQGNTKHTNGRGFSACHAYKGSYYARWCQSGRRLTGTYIDHAREIALNYVQQLLDEAHKRSQR